MDEKDKKLINPNKRLRAAREQRGWSQAALAELIGTTELTVGRWERGERSPQLHYRAKLCELFGMTAAELGLAEVEKSKEADGDEAADGSAIPGVVPKIPSQEPTLPARIDKRVISLSLRSRTIFAIAIVLLVVVSGTGFLLLMKPVDQYVCPSNIPSSGYVGPLSDGHSSCIYYAAAPTKALFKYYLALPPLSQNFYYSDCSFNTYIPANATASAARYDIFLNEHHWLGWPGRTFSQSVLAGQEIHIATYTLTIQSGTIEIVAQDQLDTSGNMGFGPAHFHCDVIMKSLFSSE